MPLTGIGRGGRKETLHMLCLSGLYNVSFTHAQRLMGNQVPTHRAPALFGRANRSPQPTFVLLRSFTQFGEFEPHQVLVSHQDVFLGERKKGHGSGDNSGRNPYVLRIWGTLGPLDMHAAALEVTWSHCWKRLPALPFCVSDSPSAMIFVAPLDK